VKGYLALFVILIALIATGCGSSSGTTTVTVTSGAAAATPAVNTLINSPSSSSSEGTYTLAATSECLTGEGATASIGNNNTLKATGGTLDATLKDGMEFTIVFGANEDEADVLYKASVAFATAFESSGGYPKGVREQGNAVAGPDGFAPESDIQLVLDCLS